MIIFMWISKLFLLKLFNCFMREAGNWIQDSGFRIQDTRGKF